MKALFLLLIFVLITAFPLRAAVVKVEKTKNGWQLVRDSAPYSVKGASVWGHDEYKMFARLEAPFEAGANSARTDHEADAQSTLDRAAKLGPTVTLGFSITPVRAGTDFGDEKSVAAIEESLRAHVQKYKAHSALLAWGLGNVGRGARQRTESQRDGVQSRTHRAAEPLARFGTRHRIELNASCAETSF